MDPYDGAMYDYELFRPMRVNDAETIPTANVCAGLSFHKSSALMRLVEEGPKRIIDNAFRHSGIW